MKINYKSLIELNNLFATQNNEGKNIFISELYFKLWGEKISLITFFLSFMSPLVLKKNLVFEHAIKQCMISTESERWYASVQDIKNRQYNLNNFLYIKVEVNIIKMNSKLFYEWMDLQKLMEKY